MSVEKIKYAMNDNKYSPNNKSVSFQKNEDPA